MSEIIIPERILLTSLRSLLKLIRDDYNGQVDKNDSYLYRILGTINLDRYKFFDQAKQVLIANNDDPRFLEIQLFFKLTRAGLPTIHITLPNENSGLGGLNIDENFQEQEISDDGLSYRPVYSRRFDTTYNLVITSDNTNEVVLIYHFLRAMLIPLFDHLNASGLEQCRISGSDLNLSHILPPNIFVRAINLSFSYDVNVAKLFDSTVINSLIFNAIMLDPDAEEDSSDSGIFVTEVEGSTTTSPKRRYHRRFETTALQYAYTISGLATVAEIINFHYGALYVVSNQYTISGDVLTFTGFDPEDNIECNIEFEL